jgi:hypothetical protein
MPLFLLILLLVIIVMVIRRRKQKKRNALIIADPAHSVANVTGFRYANKYGGKWIRYEFQVDNTVFWSEKKVHGSRQFNYLKDCRFPVIYCKHNPLMNALLITDTDFNAFQVQQPEELKIFNKKLS